MTLGREEVPLRRFNSFPVIPEMPGDFDELAMPAGEGVGLVRSIEPAAVVTGSVNRPPPYRIC